MSSFVKSFISQDGGEQRLSPEISAFHDEFPELCDAMLGAKDPDGKQAIPPVTLMLFVEGDKVKFCLSPKYGDKIAFGTLVGAEKGLSGVEQAIKAGQFEWKKRGRK